MNNNDGGDYTPKPEGQYWASVPASELGAQVRSRYLEYLRELEMRSLIAAWRRTAQTFYGYDPATGSLSDWITQAGEQGQFLSLHVNEFASLVRHQHILATAERIEFDAIPTSDSPQAEAQASLGKQVIRYYQGEGELDATLVQGVLRMLLFGGSYITQLWDVFAGPQESERVEDVQVYDDAGEPMMERVEVPAPGMPQMGMQEEPAPPEMMLVEQPVTRERVARGGDIVHRVYSPIDVARDIGCRTHKDCKWFVVRERVDRWELAARFPEKRMAILERPAFDRDESARYERGQISVSTLSRSDQIHVLRFVHDRCEALPQGLEALVCGDVLLMPPGALPYKRLPVHPMVASEHLDTPMGHTSNADLLGPQAAMNAAAINGLTASDAGSRPVWALPKNSGVDVSDMSRGVIHYTVNPQAPGGGKPELLQGPQLNEAHIKGMSLWRDEMQGLSGINAVVRGQSEGKSGADNALLQAQAVQYQSGNTMALATCARSLGLGIIEILQRFATEERMVRITGEDETPSIAYFSSADLEDIRHVEVDLGDPILRTMAGRKAVASELLERFPQEVDATKYLEFMATGRLEPLWKSQRNQVRLIRAENAALAKGESVVVMIADWHLHHLREHHALLSSPQLRLNPQLASAVLEHCKQHEIQWGLLAMRPALLAATGQPPPPPGPMGPPMGGPPGAGPMGPPPDANAPPQERANVPGGPAEVAGVPMPAMPKNASTGEQNGMM